MGDKGWACQAEGRVLRPSPSRRPEPDSTKPPKPGLGFRLLLLSKHTRKILLHSLSRCLLYRLQLHYCNYAEKDGLNDRLQQPAALARAIAPGVLQYMISLFIWIESTNCFTKPSPAAVALAVDDEEQPIFRTL
jgi:hypothetical protein